MSKLPTPGSLGIARSALRHFSDPGVRAIIERIAEIIGPWGVRKDRPARRGPKATGDDAWLHETAATLALRCKHEGVIDPFALDAASTADWSGYSAKNGGKSIRNALSERGFLPAHLHAE